MNFAGLSAVPGLAPLVNRSSAKWQAEPLWLLARQLLLEEVMPSH